MKPISVAIVGAGGMGNVHFQNYKHIEGVSITAVVDKNAAARSRADEWGVPYFSSLDAVTVPFDVVDICAPTFLHKELVMRALYVKTSSAKNHLRFPKPTEPNSFPKRKNAASVCTPHSYCSLQKRSNTCIKSSMKRRTVRRVPHIFLGFPSVLRGRKIRGFLKKKRAALFPMICTFTIWISSSACSASPKTRAIMRTAERRYRIPNTQPSYTNIKISPLPPKLRGTTRRSRSLRAGESNSKTPSSNAAETI